MTTPLTELCDQLDQLRAAATPMGWSLADPSHRALIEAQHAAIPQLTAALRAVEALAEELDSEGSDARTVGRSLTHTVAANALTSAATRIRTALATVSQVGQP